VRRLRRLVRLDSHVREIDMTAADDGRHVEMREALSTLPRRIRAAVVLPVGPDQILPVLLDPGRYRLTLESHVIDDVSFDGQPPEVTLGARCVESFDVGPDWRWSSRP